MMQKCRMIVYSWIERIKAIERDHASTRLALDRLLDEARRDPTILTGDLEPQDIVEASGRLETHLPHPLVRRIRDGPPPVLGDDPGDRAADAALAGRHRRQVRSHPIASRTPMRCESIGTPWCMSETRKWPRSRSRRLGDTCAASSRSCRRPGDRHPERFPAPLDEPCRRSHAGDTGPSSLAEPDHETRADGARPAARTAPLGRRLPVGPRHPRRRGQGPARGRRRAHRPVREEPAAVL